MADSYQEHGVYRFQPLTPRLLDQVRERIRYKHYSIRTERAYVEWVKRFVLFHGKRHPARWARPSAPLQYRRRPQWY